MDMANRTQTNQNVSADAANDMDEGNSSKEYGSLVAQTLVGISTVGLNLLLAVILCKLKSAHLNPTTRYFLIYEVLSHAGLGIILLARLYLDLQYCFVIGAIGADLSALIITGRFFLALDSFVCMKKPYTYRFILTAALGKSFVLISFCFWGVLLLIIIATGSPVNAADSGLCSVNDGSIHPKVLVVFTSILLIIMLITVLISGWTIFLLKKASSKMENHADRGMVSSQCSSRTKNTTFTNDHPPGESPNTPGNKNNVLRASTSLQTGNKNNVLQKPITLQTGNERIVLQTPITLQTGNESNVLQTPITLQTGNESNVLQTPITLQTGNESNLLQTPITLQTGNESNGLQTPITLQTGNESNVLQASTSLQTGNKNNVLQTPIILKTGNKNNLLQTPITLQTVSKNNVLQTPITLQTDNKKDALQTPIILQTPNESNVLQTPITEQTDNKNNVLQTPITLQTGNESNVLQTPITLQTGNESNVLQTPITLQTGNESNVLQTPITLQTGNESNVLQTPITLQTGNESNVLQTPITLQTNIRKKSKQTRQGRLIRLLLVLLIVALVVWPQLFVTILLAAVYDIIGMDRTRLDVIRIKLAALIMLDAFTFPVITFILNSEIRAGAKALFCKWKVEPQ